MVLLASAVVLATLTLIALVAPWIMPHDPGEFISGDAFAPSTRAALLGTDYLGRDILSRLIASAPLTLGMAFGATVLAHIAGDSLGLYAALRGGWVDAVVSRMVDVILSLPKIIVGLVVLAALGPSIAVIIGICAVVYAAGVFRVARALGNDIVRQDYIVVAQARGEGLTWLLFAEILPQVAAPLASDFAIRMSFAVLFISSLSFLGLGVQPPMADWGGLVRENLDGLQAGSFAAIYPAAAIAITSIALNMLVDSLSERSIQGPTT
jgi:peptide/nickel transport system permease protein